MKQTQFHRARERLVLAGRTFAPFFGVVDDIRSAHKSDWPPHIFIPFGMLDERAPEIIRGMFPFRVTPGIFGSIALAGNMWAAWRITQGIYRLHRSIVDPLLQTEQPGDIPVEILTRLPEWAVYVEMPALPFGTLKENDAKAVIAHGFWAQVTTTYGNDLNLSIMVDADIDPDDPFDAIAPFCLGLVLSRSVKADRVFNVAKSMSDACVFYGNRAIRLFPEWVNAAINLLVFICSQNDFCRDGKPATPTNPEPVRTRRRGLRLFPAPKPTVWDVGVRIGASLTAASSESSDGGEGTGQHKRPHIRRAHWHGFRSGRRIADDGSLILAQDRPFELKWIPPIAVGISDDSELPAVIRRVGKLD
jgi:hypothetical protein